MTRIALVRIVFKIKSIESQKVVPLVHRNPTDVLWRLRKQLYGRRRGGTRWVDFMAERLEEQSFDRCEAALLFFVNYSLDVSVEVHMDDLHGTGPKPALDLVRTNFSQTIRFKVWTVYEIETRYEHLTCERVLHEDRTEIVPNPKYLRIVLHSNGLTSCKLAPTSSIAGSVTQTPDDDIDLDTQECRLHRGIVGSLQYLSIHRCDVQFETNACAKEMKQPTRASWTQLKRLARYQAGTQSARVVLVKLGAGCDSHEALLRVWSDSDLAWSAKDRKSQSSLKIDVDGCLLYSVSRMQKRHAHTQVARLISMLQYRPPVKQC